MRFENEDSFEIEDDEYTELLAQLREDYLERYNESGVYEQEKIDQMEQ